MLTFWFRVSLGSFLFWRMDLSKASSDIWKLFPLLAGLWLPDGFYPTLLVLSDQYGDCTLLPKLLCTSLKWCSSLRANIRKCSGENMDEPEGGPSGPANTVWQSSQSAASRSSKAGRGATALPVRTSSEVEPVFDLQEGPGSATAWPSQVEGDVKKLSQWNTGKLPPVRVFLTDQDGSGAWLASQRYVASYWRASVG